MSLNTKPRIIDMAAYHDNPNLYHYMGSNSKGILSEDKSLYDYRQEGTINSLQCQAFTGTTFNCPSPFNVTKGNTASTSISWSGGVSPYSITVVDRTTGATLIPWTGLNIASTSTSISITTSNLSVGTHTLYFTVADSCSTRQYATSGNCDLNVVAATSCGSMSGVTLSAPASITQGTSASFQISWSGGQGGFTVALFESGNPNSIGGWQTITNGGTINRTINLSVGVHSLYVRVADFCGGSSVQQYAESGAVSVSVVAASSGPSISITSCPSGNAVLGSTIQFGLSWSGGTGPYTIYIYNTADNTYWYKQTGVSGGSATINVPVYGSAGSSYNLGFRLDDSSSPIKTAYSSNTCTANVVAPSTCRTMSGVTFTCPSSVTKGTNASFKVSWSGGQGPYTGAIFESGVPSPVYGWFNLTNGQTVVAPINLSTGNHNLYINVADFCGGSSVQQYASSPTCAINVTSPSTCGTMSGASLACPSASVTQGSPAAFKISWSGGQGPFTAAIFEQGASSPLTNFAWASITNGATISGNITLSAGTHNLYVSVADFCGGNSVQQYASSPTCTINVTAPSTCGTMSSVAITCPSGNIVSGTSASFKISWSGGQGPFTASIYQLNAASPFINWQSITNGGTISGTVNFSGGGYSVYARVADFCGGSSVQQYASSGTCMLNVGGCTTLIVGAVSCAGDGYYLMGDTAWFSLSWSGGQGPYDVRFYLVSNGSEIFRNSSYNGTSITVNIPLTTFFGSAGNYEVSAKVIDTCSQTVSASSSCTIHVVAYRLAGISPPSMYNALGSPVPTPIVSGTSATFGITWIGSSPPYSLTLVEDTYKSTLVPWTGWINGTPVTISTPYGDMNALTANLTVSGYWQTLGWYNIYAIIADSHGQRQYIGTPSVYTNVVDQPCSAIFCTLDSNFIGANGINFTVKWSGGTSPYWVFLYVDGTVNSPLTPTSSMTSTSYSVTTDTTTLSGDHTIRAEVWSQCPDKTWKSASSSVKVSLLPRNCPSAVVDIHWDFVPLVNPIITGGTNLGRTDYTVILSITSAVKVTWSDVSSSYILSIYSDNETRPRWNYGPWNGSGGMYCGSGKKCILAALWDTGIPTGWHKVYAVLSYQCSDGSWKAVTSPTTDVYTLYWPESSCVPGYTNINGKCTKNV